MNTYLTELKQQIGHQAFFMLGAKDFVCSDQENYLMFRIRGSKKWNKIKIKYNAGHDLYEMTFYKIWKYGVRSEKTVTGIYCDMLHETIETETGLYTKLF